MRPPRSVRVRIDDLAAGPCGQRDPDRSADAVLDEPDRTVHEAHAHAARVPRAGADDGVVGRGVPVGAEVLACFLVRGLNMGVAAALAAIVIEPLIALAAEA